MTNVYEMRACLRRPVRLASIGQSVDSCRGDALLIVGEEM
jgi:hypothetical protein